LKWPRRSGFSTKRRSRPYSFDRGRGNRLGAVQLVADAPQIGDGITQRQLRAGQRWRLGTVGQSADAGANLGSDTSDLLGKLLAQALHGRFPLGFVDLTGFSFNSISSTNVHRKAKLRPRTFNAWRKRMIGGTSDGAGRIVSRNVGCVLSFMRPSLIRPTVHRLHGR
jgi:hypothetical protein